MVEEVRKYLTTGMIPFWKRMKDTEYGGYYGEMDYELYINPKACKGGILHSRILWFFSNVYLEFGEESLLDCARHGYEFLRDKFWDQEYGGMYWSVNYDGTPADDMKHTYCQAFSIYGLSAYYRATKEEGALQLAWELFEIIEGRCRDAYGYEEGFSRNFSPMDNEKLSENGVMAEKTMNTVLHVLEAYSELYRVLHEEQRENAQQVGEKIVEIFRVIAECIYNPKKKRQEVFFNKQYKSILDLHSYGHDIEAAWLIDRACEILGKNIWSKKMGEITTALTEMVYETAFTGESLYNECCRGQVDRIRIWWVQAEAITGFLNGYEKNKKDKKYYDGAVAIWDFIKEYMIDHRQNGEWFWAVDDQGVPDKTKGVVDLWKCPYHNGRMCLEVIRRLKG